MRLFFLALCLFLLPELLTAQLVELQEKGVLVVRLESGVKQKAFLQDKIEAGEDVEKWERLLAEREAEVIAKNKLLMRLFEAEYNFSDILFMYDYDSKALRDGSSRPIFLDKDMKLDARLRLNDRPYLVVTETPSETGLEGFAILGGDLKQVERPLPDFIKFNTVFYLFNSLGSTAMAEEKMYLNAIRRLQRKFNKKMLKG
jgi:hypothetical protein